MSENLLLRAFSTRRLSVLLTAWLLALGAVLWAGTGSAPSSGPRPGVSPEGQAKVIRIDPLKKNDPPSSNTPNFSGKRDPFKLPVILSSKPGINGNGGGQWPMNRPPGIRGLIISQLKLVGIASEKANHVMIAVVSDDTHRAYFPHGCQTIEFERGRIMRIKLVIRWLVAGLLLAVICALTGERAASRHLTAGKAGAGTLSTALAVLPLDPLNAYAWEPSAELSAFSRADARITQISIQADQQGTEFVKIGTTGPVQIKPLRLGHPARLVVDLQPVQVRHFRRIVADREGILQDVRLAQFQNSPTAVARVVADLSQNAPFRIQSEPDGIRIEFREPEKSVRNSRRGLNVLLKSAIPQHEDMMVRALERPVKLDPASFHPEPQESPHRTPGEKLSVAGKAHGTIESRNASQQPTVGGYPAKLEPQRQQPVSDSTSAATSATEWASAHLPEAAPPSLAELQQTLQTVQIAADSSSTPDAFEKQGAGILNPPFSQQHHRFTGKLISLDLRDVDIRDFFRLIHQISGLNIVVDSNVTGRITMVMDDVPWDQALSIALKDNGLSTELEGNVLRIAKVSTLVDEAKAEADERTAKLEAEPLVTVVRQLKYAHAADQQPMQTTSIGGGGGMGGSANQLPIPGVVTMLASMKGVLTPDGKAVADPRDNAVIITDHRSQIPVIESVIDKLDAKAPQVSIQVRVILANADFTRTLSAALSGAARNRSGNTLGGIGTGNGSMGTFTNNPPAPVVGSNATSA